MFFKVKKQQNSLSPTTINFSEGQASEFELIMCYSTCPTFKFIIIIFKYNLLIKNKTKSIYKQKKSQLSFLTNLDKTNPNPLSKKPW